jgi:hypothetical protein
MTALIYERKSGGEPLWDRDGDSVSQLKAKAKAKAGLSPSRVKSFRIKKSSLGLAEGHW